MSFFPPLPLAALNARCTAQLMSFLPRKMALRVRNEGVKMQIETDP